MSFKPNNPEYEVKGTKLVVYKGSNSTVLLPAGVTEIGSKAFLCNKTIKTVVIPDGVISIETDIRSEANTFGECVNLEKLVIPDTLNNMLNIPRSERMLIAIQSKLAADQISLS